MNPAENPPATIELSVAEHAAVDLYVKTGNKLESFFHYRVLMGYTDPMANPMAACYAFWSQPHVAAEIARRNAYIAELAGIPGERVIAELAAVALTRLTDVAEYKDGVLTIFPTETLDPMHAAAIKSIRVRETFTEDGVKRETEIELHDKMKALSQLSKNLGLDKTKPKASAKTIFQIISPGSKPELVED